MRLTDSLTIPTELERARAAGDLVVFAGAGVSMGSPANLPSFVDLAKGIAEPKVPCRRADQKWLDRYLGRAEREGIDVQRRARDLLEVGGSHTPVHEYLLGIFGTAARVRLITTNFDRHFSTALTAVFPRASIPRYIGPALPPGHDFQGIAQLHGALGREESRLVLTDRDFAEAYMAEGWAARFLARAFAGRTVLFVGYSLTDPVMRYLLHALRAGRWYALWRAAEVGQGSEHAITPVTFGKRRSRRPYKDLSDGMKRWYWYARASPTDHDRAIRELVASGPPTSSVDADYLRARLETAEGRLVFRTKAASEVWFDWVASEGLLDGLVTPAAGTLEVSEWAAWCLEHFCGGDIPPLLRYLRGQPLTLNPAFRTQLVHHLVRRATLPPRSVLQQLIALLVGQSTDTAYHHSLWRPLMKRLVEGGYALEALALLRPATRLSLQPLENGYPTREAEEGEESVLHPLATRVSTQVTAHDIVDFLTKHGPALAATSSDALLALGEQRIEEAYELLELSRGRNDGSDWLSLGRASVAPSVRGRFIHVEDVLVETVRAVLEHFAGADPASLQAFAIRHEVSARALLRRLALYAVSRCASCSSDDVLSRAVTRGWARDVWLRPELYLVLGAHFPLASEPAKSDFVSALRDNAWWGEDFDKHNAHTRFSLSVKLLRDAPDSVSAREFAAAEREAHPDGVRRTRKGSCRASRSIGDRTNHRPSRRSNSWHSLPLLHSTRCARHFLSLRISTATWHCSGPYSTPPAPTRSGGASCWRSRCKGIRYPPGSPSRCCSASATLIQPMLCRPCCSRMSQQAGGHLNSPERLPPYWLTGRVRSGKQQRQGYSTRSTPRQTWSTSALVRWPRGSRTRAGRSGPSTIPRGTPRRSGGTSPPLATGSMTGRWSH